MEERNITKIVRNMNLYKNKINNKKGDNLNSTEYEMLRYIAKREERNLSDVVSYLNVDKGLVSRMSKKLSELNYIEIISDNKDSRKKIVKPTLKGIEKKEEIYNEEMAFYNACFKVLNDKEKEELDSLIEKVYLESKRLRKSNFEGIR